LRFNATHDPADVGRYNDMAGVLAEKVISYILWSCTILNTSMREPSTTNRHTAPFYWK